MKPLCYVSSLLYTSHVAVAGSCLILLSCRWYRIGIPSLLTGRASLAIGHHLRNVAKVNARGSLVFHDFQFQSSCAIQLLLALCTVKCSRVCERQTIFASRTNNLHVFVALLEKGCKWGNIVFSNLHLGLVCIFECK